MFVHQADTRVAATLQSGVEVIDREADVMDARSSLFKELSDWRVGFIRFEQFNQGLAGGEPADPGSVAVGKLGLGHSEDIAIE
jgi:hypothetical protein